MSININNYEVLTFAELALLLTLIQDLKPETSSRSERYAMIETVDTKTGEIVHEIVLF